jgi:uncharacterized protein
LAGSGHRLWLQCRDAGPARRVRAYRRRSDPEPGIGRTEFDLLIVPEHDRVRGPQVIITRGAVDRVTPARLEVELCRFPALVKMPRPVLSVLIGGTNKAYRLTAQRVAEIAEALGGIFRRRGGSVLVTPTQRTGSARLAVLRERLGGFPTAIWDGSGENPCFAYLALADAMLVTADSVSMISEAAATGKPVHVLDLDGGNARFSRFHEAMQTAGITRLFSGHIESWSYSIPDDTACAGTALRALVLERRQPA